jgi:hypothetical protein
MDKVATCPGLDLFNRAQANAEGVAVNQLIDVRCCREGIRGLSGLLASSLLKGGVGTLPSWKKRISGHCGTALTYGQLMLEKHDGRWIAARGVLAVLSCGGIA